jgi:hypothetical protein
MADKFPILNVEVNDEGGRNSVFKRKMKGMAPRQQHAGIFASLRGAGKNCLPSVASA